MLVHAPAGGYAYLAQSSATPLGATARLAAPPMPPPPPSAAMAPPTVLGTDPDCYFDETELGAGGGVAKCEEGLELEDEEVAVELQLRQVLQVCLLGVLGQVFQRVRQLHASRGRVGRARC